MTNPSKDFAAEFARVTRSLDLSSRRPTKNQPLEQLLVRATGWPSASVKYIKEVNNLTNRIGEAGKKIGASRNVVILVPARHVTSALRTAVRLVGRDLWDLIAISAPDQDPPRLIQLVHASSFSPPAIFKEAFPDLGLHAVAIAAGDAIETPTSALESTRQPDYPLAECERETGVAAAQLLAWQTLLQRKKHLVFQGPPGTGKTFIAKRFAKTFVSGTHGEVDLAQFHPSLTYEDFVQGIRARVEEGQVHYAVESGRFLRFCDDARATPDSPFVLILDEMNRGNVARIFGELLYLLEYRGESITLAQGEEPFSVPPNVYLIATMNTADRSIALVDHALRRRFAFVFVGPDYNRLRQWLSAEGMNDGGQLVSVLERINQRIEDKHYHLGTSYFLAAGARLPEYLEAIWLGEIEPHLDEFFFDRPSVVDEFSWKSLITTSLSWWSAAARALPTAAPSSSN